MNRQMTFRQQIQRRKCFATIIKIVDGFIDYSQIVCITNTIQHMHDALTGKWVANIFYIQHQMFSTACSILKHFYILSLYKNVCPIPHFKQRYLDYV